MSSCDVLVVGAGVAGLSTALASAKLGLATRLYEKAAKLGGGSSLAYGGLWCGCNHIAAKLGYQDSPEDTLRYMRFLAGDQADEERLLSFAARGPEALRFFEDCGLRFQVTKHFPDHYAGSAPGAREEGRCLEPALISANDLGEWRERVFVPREQPVEVTIEELIEWGGIANLRGWDTKLVAERSRAQVFGRGVALVMHFVKQLARAGVAVHLQEGAKELIHERGRVIGIATQSGERVTASRGVVLATGGYDSNERLAEHLEGLPGWRTQFPETVRGDHLAMAGEIGAATRTIQNNLAVFLGFHVPRSKPEDNILFRQASICELLCPHTMVVNADGERFGDEAYFQALAPRLREYDLVRRRHTNLPCFLIFDQQYADAFSFAYRPAGAPIPPWVAKADSVEQLGGALGIDARNLAATVERFNRFARAGKDEDFGRGKSKWTQADDRRWKPTREDETYLNPRLGTIRVPPFYGIELHPSAFVSHGLVANRHAQVMHVRGRPIDRLYAVGNAAAHTEWGVGYQAGYSLSSGMTFGYLAARHMAGMTH
ncbi:MAG: FAD-dependent oxidoreductase [Burkholderiales bacterium]